MDGGGHVQNTKAAAGSGNYGGGHGDKGSVTSGGLGGIPVLTNPQPDFPIWHTGASAGSAGTFGKGGNGGLGISYTNKLGGIEHTYGGSGYYGGGGGARW